MESNTLPQERLWDQHSLDRDGILVLRKTFSLNQSIFSNREQGSECILESNAVESSENCHRANVKVSNLLKTAQLEELLIKARSHSTSKSCGCSMKGKRPLLRSTMPSASHSFTNGSVCKKSKIGYNAFSYVFLSIWLFMNVCCATVSVDPTQSRINNTTAYASQQASYDLTATTQVVMTKGNSSEMLGKNTTVPWYAQKHDPQSKAVKCSDRIFCFENDLSQWLDDHKFVTIVMKLIAEHNLTLLYNYTFNEEGELTLSKKAIGVNHAANLPNSTINSLSTIREFLSRKNSGNMVKRFNNSEDMVRRHQSLCNDERTAAFLLDGNSENWPIACVWSGSDKNSTCAPAPFPANSTKTISYIPPMELRKKLAHFRARIGCSFQEMSQLRNIEELYYCREKCTDTGLGIVDIIILMVSIYTILALICTEEPPAARVNN
ncbi:hypothetical protein Ddc_19277 [Ditylenchus destructor]|nr:hypothetical protein Ddc_19277 [Ditylenchus destructor]